MRRMREEVVFVISSWSLWGLGRSCFCVRKGRLKVREIDIIVVRREGVEMDKKDFGFYYGRERRKLDLYDKRKDRLDDSVVRDFKKFKIE